MINLKGVEGDQEFKYTEEEQIERRRQANMRCYYNNHEYYKLYSRLHKAEIRKAKKNED